MGRTRMEREHERVAESARNVIRDPCTPWPCSPRVAASHGVFTTGLESYELASSNRLAWPWSEVSVSYDLLGNPMVNHGCQSAVRYILPAWSAAGQPDVRPLR